MHPLNHMRSVELTCCSRLFPSFICELVHEALLGAERNWTSLWLWKSSWRRQGWCWGVRIQLCSSTTACFSAPPALLLISSTRFGFTFQKQDSSTGYFRSASGKDGRSITWSSFRTIFSHRFRDRSQPQLSTVAPSMATRMSATYVRFHHRGERLQPRKFVTQ
jgi:hypothetical protein